MKKKILGLAFIAMTLLAFNGAAQTADNSKVCKNTCTKDKADCSKKDNVNNRRAEFNPFDGIQLTDSQKAQLNQLKDKRKAARDEKNKTAKVDKQRRDSVGLADRRAAKKQYLEDVKAIIGPDQYVIFLENMVVNAGPQGGAKSGMQAKNGQKRKVNADRRAGKSNHHAMNPQAKNETTANANS